MPDPRDIAQDKKKFEEKQKHHEAPLPGAAETPQPGKKPKLEDHEAEAESYQQHAHHHEDAEPAE